MLSLKKDGGSRSGVSAKVKRWSLSSPPLLQFKPRTTGRKNRPGFFDLRRWRGIEGEPVNQSQFATDFLSGAALGTAAPGEQKGATGRDPDVGASFSGYSLVELGPSAVAKGVNRRSLPPTKTKGGEK